MGNKKTRKTARIAVSVINLLFPVRDIARIVMTAPKPLLMTLRRTREVFNQQAKEQADLSWAEALAASGCTEAALARPLSPQSVAVASRHVGKPAGQPHAVDAGHWVLDDAECV